MDDTTRVRRLLQLAGTTYAIQAGIRLKNTPMPLFQLLVLSMLAAKPIAADTATKAAAELWKAGLRTPAAVLEAKRHTMIDAFGRAGYARYDESSADRLHDMAGKVDSDYFGDMRRLAAVADRRVAGAMRRLEEFTGIGDTGASIFLREVQDVWPWVRPYFDERALAAARRLGLPPDPEKLGALAPQTNAGLAAALVRVSLDDDLSARITG
ncbi:MAG TPA: endonuclease [Mycobacterium sp.]|nr:endonuclease [Mycobacterium sp.]